MMLQSLSDFYETLARNHKAPPAGWAETGVNFALQLNDRGEITEVIDLRQTVEKTQKNGKVTTKLVPQTFAMPLQANRTSSIQPHLLCDTSTYLLGFRTDKEDARCADAFEASKDAHLSLLEQTYSPAAEALKQFFKTWRPDTVSTHPVIGPNMELLGTGKLIFRYDTSFIHEDPDIMLAYQNKYETDMADPDVRQMICMDTCEMGPIKRVHEQIMGLPGTKGATLVSANSDSATSYGWKQSAIAPMSIHVAENYVKALNYMLKNPDMHCSFGDTTVVFWANSTESAYSDFFNDVMQNGYKDTDIYSIVQSISENKPAIYDETKLSPNMEFHILGLSPNQGRIIVRFYMVNTFGKFLQNIHAHYDRLSICNGDTVQSAFPVWQMLLETTNQKSKNRQKEIKPHLGNQIIENILNGKPYPMTMLSGINTRLKAEIYNGPIPARKAAMIKAYYMAFPGTTESMKGALTMSLNTECTDTGYLLGRLFAELEHLQDNATSPQTGIRAQYFNRACTMPSQVFPYMINMAQKHLKKLYARESTKPKAVWHDKRIAALLNQLDNQYPTRLSVQEQGSFQLGYYHQRNQRFIKKNADAPVESTETNTDETISTETV